MTTSTPRAAVLSGIAIAMLTPGVTAQPSIPRDQALAQAGALRPLVERLFSPDPKARAEAACEIGKRRAAAAAAIPALLTMLSDDVTVPALECGMTPWLRRTLATSPDAARWAQTSPANEAAEALGNIGNASVPGLLQALSHADWKTRKFAARGLAEVDRIADPAVVAALAERLADTYVDVRDQSAWALGEIEDPAAVEPLVNALRDADAGVRAQAAWALGEIEDPAAVNGLVTALNDPDAAVRAKAVWALGEIESANAVDALLPLLRDHDAQIRRQTAWALGEIEHPDAVPALVSALQDGDSQVRRTAAWALGEIEDPRAIDGLRAAANDANAEVRRAVTQALRELRDRRQ